MPTTTARTATPREKHDESIGPTAERREEMRPESGEPRRRPRDERRERRQHDEQQAAERPQRLRGRERRGRAAGPALSCRIRPSPRACWRSRGARDVGQRQGIDLERAERRDQRMNWRAGLDRILEVGFGVDFCASSKTRYSRKRIAAARFGAFFGHRSTRDVHLGAAPANVGRIDLDRLAPLQLFRTAGAAAHQSD